MSPMPRDRGVKTGVMMLEDDSRVDFADLRATRRERVFAEMDRADIDVLLLGGVGNVHYATGVRALGRSGVIPFAPACVLVRETGRVHVLATWDEGVPPEIGYEDMYRIFWNPGNLAGALAEIPGMSDARRIGTDGLSPLFGRLLSDVFASAELVDADAVMNRARRTKTTGEIACLDVASAIAEAALSALDAALQPGVTERELLGIYYESVARLGTPNVPSESVAFATPAAGPVGIRSVASDRPIGDGELVVLSPGALYAGYQSGLARTRFVGKSAPPGVGDLSRRCADGMDALLGACRAGNAGADLYRSWQDSGNGEPTVLLAHGTGMGMELPLIGLGLGADERLEQGMVLTVQSWVVSEGTGGCLERVTVLIGPGDPTILTRCGRF